MNGKYEDKLLQAAFGDLPEDDEARVLAEVESNPQAAELYAEFRSLRDGLCDLREVPEHQLSTERLRHAILEQGLRPRPTFRFGWLVPSAIAAVALFAVLNLDGLKGQSPVRTDDVGADREEVRVADVPTTVRSAEELPTVIPFGREGFEDTVSADVPAPRKSTGARTARSRDRGQARFAVRVSGEAYGPYPEPAPMTAGAGGAAAAPAPGDVPATDPGIVMIEAERDGMTGANRATEVDSPRNVVIGG